MIGLIGLVCDGRLVQTHEAKDKAFEYIGTLVDPEAGQALLAWHRANGGVNRAEKFEWLYRNFMGRPITAEECSKLSELFDAHCASSLRKAAPTPGALSVLKKWYGKIPMCVASAAPQSGIEQLLRAKGMDAYMRKIYGYPPGKTELLRKAIADSGAASLATVMVGDSMRDQQAAETLGTLFYGIGETMKSCGAPWHPDLTQFNAWLSDRLA